MPGTFIADPIILDSIIQSLLSFPQLLFFPHYLIKLPLVLFNLVNSNWFVQIPDIC